ncbi:hypothetical protein Tco_0524627 [Tanacetum coccineum]
MTGTKFDIEKFDGMNDFGLWKVRMKALLELQGLASTLEELPAATIVAYDNVIQKKAYNALILCLGDRLVGDLVAIDTAISDADQALLLLASLPLSYNNFVETLLYGQDTLRLEDVLATLNSRELQKMTEAKGDGGEGLCEGEIWSERYKSEEHLKRDSPMYNHKKSQGLELMSMTMSVDELLDWIMDSGGSYHMTYMRDYLVDFEEYDSDNILLGDGTECRVRGTGKVQVQMRDGSSFVLDKVRYGSVQVLQELSLRLEPHEDHFIEVEPHGNVDHVVGSQEANIWATKGLMDKAKGNVLGMEIVRDQSGNTLRVSHSRFYNGKLVQTLLEGHSILSSKGSLSGYYDVEKNNKRTCFVDSDYAIGRSITMYEFMIQGCVGSCKAYVQHMKALSTTEAAYMTLTEAAKEAIWLKELAIESGFELKIVAGIATCALSKAIPSPRFQHWLKLLRIEEG